MIRFAMTVTAIELVLTMGASLFIAATEGYDPHLTQDDMDLIGIPYENFQTLRRTRYLTATSYESTAILPSGSQKLRVSHIMGARAEDYNLRLERERELGRKSAPGRMVVVADPFPDENGYAVRQNGRNLARCEVVRMRAETMLIVEVYRTDSNYGVNPSEAANCERNARVVLNHMLEKLGWR